MVKDMTIIFITTEELCPETLSLFGHFKKLKAQHPRLKLTAFCPGRYHDKKENDLVKSDKFWKFYKENRDWIEIAANGVTWELPPEFTKFNNHQKRIIKKMSAKLRKYFPAHQYIGLKAPHSKVNEQTLDNLKRAGYSYLIEDEAIIFLQEMNHYPFGYNMIHSTMGLNETKVQKDNISLIREKIHKQLLRYEKIGITYMTVGEYIRQFKVV